MTFLGIALVLFVLSSSVVPLDHKLLGVRDQFHFVVAVVTAAPGTVFGV